MATSERSTAHAGPFSVLLASTAFPIFGWAIIQVLRQVPSWILRLSVWDLVGVIAYTQMIALLETALVLAIGALAVWLLGKVWGSVPSKELVGWWILVGGVFFSLFHILDVIWGFDRLEAILLAAIVFLTLALAGTFLLFNERAQRVFHEVVRRVSILTYLYLLVGIASMAIVVARNL